SDQQPAAAGGSAEFAALRWFRLTIQRRPTTRSFLRGLPIEASASPRPQNQSERARNAQRSQDDRCHIGSKRGVPLRDARGGRYQRRVARDGNGADLLAYR